ncbi:MAG: metallophosphoesterase family protein [Bacteroidota bacterium]
MEKNWVIGDVHGCLKTFRRLVEDRLQPSSTDTLYLLGDYINKGPDSKGVIDYIFALQREKRRVITLMGNHEEMMLSARRDVSAEQRLLKAGGRQMLQSFGVDKLANVPQRYFDWMESLPSYLVLQKYVLVHAGLNFSLANPFSDERAMRWIRDFSVYPEAMANRVLIHGHTPVGLEVTQSQLSANPITVVNLDGGCVYTDRPNQGHLLALELGSWTLVVQKNVEEAMQE